MAGLKSRRKGMRVEYGLRDYLRLMMWEAHRVPASGASEGFKGDIVARKDGKELKFESKASKSVFNTLYCLYEENMKLEGNDLMSLAYGQGEHMCINISTSLDAVLENPSYYKLVTTHALYPKYKKTFDKIKNLERLKATADILVLKADRKPFLFISFK